MPAQGGRPNNGAPAPGAAAGRGAVSPAAASEAAASEAAAPPSAAAAPPSATAAPPASTTAPGESLPSPELLLELCRARMPFGKYKGSLLLRVPEAYLAWFARQGMPKGKFGMLLESALVVRSSGLESLVEPLLRQVEAEDRRRAGEGGGWR